MIEMRSKPRMGQRLTARERQVVEGAVRGTQLAQIGRELGLRASTVSTHLANAMIKLGVGGRADLIRRWGPPEEVPAKSVKLTVAEQDIVQLLFEVGSNAEIARIRGRSERTVANQVSMILRKLEATSRAQIVAWAVQAGLGPTREAAAA